MWFKPYDETNPWLYKLVNACNEGNLETIERLVGQQDDVEVESHGIEIHDLFARAITNDHPKAVKLLLELFPDFPRCDCTHIIHQGNMHESFDEYCLRRKVWPINYAILEAQHPMPIFRILVERWPVIKVWHYGEERGEHLGWAAANGDLEFVEYLLSIGVSASRAFHLWFPALRVLQCQMNAHKKDQASIWTWMSMTPRARALRQQMRKKWKIYDLLKSRGAGDTIDWGPCSCPKHKAQGQNQKPTT